MDDNSNVARQGEPVVNPGSGMNKDAQGAVVEAGG